MAKWVITFLFVSRANKFHATAQHPCPFQSPFPVTPPPNIPVPSNPPSPLRLSAYRKGVLGGWLGMRRWR